MAVGRLIVVKVGGSLLGWAEFPSRLRAELDRHAGDRRVLVVGGGKGADFIRELDSLHGIGEKRSHRLALRVLDVTAHLAAALVPGLEVVEGPEGLPGAWGRGSVPVLAPRRALEDHDGDALGPLPECWAVTTDSIAARVAEVLGADELRLLKSTGLGGITDRGGAARAGVVDRYFPTASARLRRVTVVNLRGDPPTVEVLD